MKLTTSVLSRQRSLLLLLPLLLGMLRPGLMGQAQTVGKWSTLSYTMPINPIHVALLHNGKILVVAGSGNCPASLSGCPAGAPYGPGNGSGALLLDSTNGNITQFSVSWDMFCNGMVVLSDGRAFINGGTLAYDPFQGSPKSSIFDPATNTFSSVPNMAHGRWYPTLTTLGDGRVMTFSGGDENGNTNNKVEIYTVGSGWSQPISAPFTPDLYPRMHLLPNGKVFASGAPPSAYIFNPANSSFTQNVATTNYGGTRTYGSSVLLPLTPANNYDPKIMIFGGNSPATSTTEIIDMGASSPQWAPGPNMSQARIEMNAVILPNGKVLAMGGSVNDESSSTKSLNADLYDPDSNTFSSAGANAYARLYHSVALLLPDATVWLAGGNPSRGTYESHIEIYQPAYLFQSNGTPAPRPSITSAPHVISYGNQFTVQTPDAASIASAVLIRYGSVTHAFGMDQRMVGMSFTAASGSLTVTAPPDGNTAPPGYYMLFILNSNGVPSVASPVLLSSSVVPAPTVGSISPASGTISGGTGVAISGAGFLAGATVSLGGTAATGVTVVNSTSITATTPAHAAGAVDVTVTNSDSQSGTLTGGYTYSSSSGGGISFVQAGSGPSTAQPSNSTLSVPYPSPQTAGNLNIVAVGWGDTTSSISSVSDTTGNTYVLAVGPTTTTGLQQSIYYAKNITAGSNTVTVTFNQSAAFPDVRILEYSGLETSAALDVTAAAVGTGTNANSGAATTTSANELLFGAGSTAGTSYIGAGTGFTSRIINAFGNIAEDETVNSAGSYSATAPNGSGNWVMQMATFRASGEGGANPAPTVTGVSPASGTVSGGTALTITGTGFLAGAAVSLGGTAATGVTVVSSTSITATTAAHSAGSVDVVVTNTDTQSGSLTEGYTYTTLSNPGPTVTAISPSSGPTDGGTPVNITGTGFLAGATVSLGETPATGVTVVSGTSITATTPAHAAGAVNVVVTNTEEQSGTLTSGYTYSSTTAGLGLGVPSGDSGSATVVAGQAATYTLSIGGAGMSGSASLSCTGAPTGANCSVPASQQLSSTTPTTFNVSVTTTARTAAALHLPAFTPVTWLWAFAALGIVVLPRRKRAPKRSLRRYLRIAPLALLLFLGSCGGGSTGSPQPGASGTPAGTYTLNVKATSGATSQTASLTLIVQ